MSRSSCHDRREEYSFDDFLNILLDTVDNNAQHMAGCCYQVRGSVDIVNILQWWGDNSALIMGTNIDNLYFTLLHSV